MSSRVRLRLFLVNLAMLALIAVGWIVSDRPSIDVALPPAPDIFPTSSPSAMVPDRSFGNAEVIRTVDGDTFVVRLDQEEGEWTIRMLGVDTPETVDPRKGVQCFGKEASTRLRALLSGQRVRLESDPQADERDKYGRLLRNVFLSDGTDVNAFLVQEGYAHAYLSFPLNPQRKRTLKDLEDQARQKGAGLWSTETCSGTPKGI